MKRKNIQKGFTLIEVLLVLGIIAVLAGIVLVAVNPSRQFKQARDTQRQSNVVAILNAIGQNVADNRGVFTCAGGPVSIPQSPGEIMKSDAGGFDIEPCLVPLYLPSLPNDPLVAQPGAGYDTGYTIARDSTTDRITISAQSEVNTTETISVTR
jgi:prepilin-type N-terminal cleavage/methylation domain-containing protein